MSLEGVPYFQWGMSLSVRFGSIIGESRRNQGVSVIENEACHCHKLAGHFNNSAPRIGAWRSAGRYNADRRLAWATRGVMLAYMVIIGLLFVGVMVHPPFIR